MAYEVSWSFSINDVPADQTTLQNQCKSFLLWLKNKLVAAGGTVVYSSNGTTASAADNWTTIADLVRASAGSNHSHSTIKMPVGTIAGATTHDYTGVQSCIWVTLDWSTGADYQITLRWHNVAPTGGSLTAVQTSTNQVGVVGYQFTRSTLTTAFFHWSQPISGGFHAGITFSGAGILTTSIAALTCLNPEQDGANLDYPYNVVMWLRFSDTGTGPLAPPYTSVYGWNADGTVSSNSFYLMSISQISSSTGIGQNGTANGSSYGSKYHNAPIVVWNSTSGKTALVGRIPDIFFTANTSANGAWDADGLRQLLGNFFVPVNAALSW